MKKNILFIIPGLDVGGGEKSLINLLTQIDFNKYNVDLFLLNNEGLFINFIPKEVKVLNIKGSLEIFNKNLREAIIDFLSKRQFRLAYSRLMFCLTNRFNKNKGIAEQHSFKYLRKSIGKIDGKYDVAIGYLEKTSNYICVDCVHANKKIGWIHTDYNKLNLDKNFDQKYFEKCNYIVTVSEECRNSLIDNFNIVENKIKIIKNVVSPTIIKKMSKENIDIFKDRKETIIVSVGRLSYEKGFDIAVKACKKLIDSGLKVKWYLVGEGNERSKLEKLIYENNLQDKFILLGAQSNPYKYINLADIYVQPSRFEGKSIAMDEAKILGKPIVATNFTTVRDQIEDKVNGIITEMNEESLSEGIVTLINDLSLKRKIKINLKEMNLGTESEIINLYKLLEE